MTKFTDRMRNALETYDRCFNAEVELIILLGLQEIISDEEDRIRQDNPHKFENASRTQGAEDEV